METDTLASPALIVPAGAFVQVDQQDPLSILLADKRSPATRKAYAADLTDFFATVYQQPPTPAVLSRFLACDQPEMARLVTTYKAAIIERGLTEATVNRRISALKSLIAMGARLGYTKVDPRNLVQGEKYKAYRDTRGISIYEARRLLRAPDRETVKGKRDYAILNLLWNNGLRRSEVCHINTGDFTPSSRELLILGKGKGTQKEVIRLDARTAAAVMDYLAASGRQDLPASEPLFVPMDNAHRGSGRLTGQSIYDLVKRYCKAAGIERTMSPHRIRHAAITAALGLTNGDVRKVQQFSRHAKVETVMIYDDRRHQFQGQVTDLLAECVC